MSDSITKEKISGWAKEIADLAENLSQQIIRHTMDEKDLETVLLYTKLVRHSMLLRDVSILLKSNPTQNLAPAFILLRCMMEDFITIFYLRTNGFKPEMFVKYFAEDFSNRFKFMQETANVNNKFFKGVYEGLPSSQHVQNFKNVFLSNQDHNNLFVNKTQFKFKSFPSPSEIIKELPITEATIANAVGLLDWIHLSEYVHHSMLSARNDTDPAVRKLEIKKLKGIMLYAYKLTEFVAARFEERNFPFTIPNTEKLLTELSQDTLDASDFIAK
jgi:hypothetical protein